MASIRELVANFRGNAQGLKSEIGSVTRDLKGLRKTTDSTSKVMGKSFDKSGRSADTFKGKILNLELGMEDQAKAVSAARKEHETLSKTYGKNSDQARRAEADLLSQIDKYDQMGRSLQGLKGDFAQFNRDQVLQSSLLFKSGNNLIKFGDGLQSISQKARDLGSTLTKRVTLPIAGLATTLGGTILSAGMSRLVGIDTARAKLEGLGHSAEGVDGIMTSALDSVKGTSFGLGEAATTAANAVAAGIEPGEELTKYLTLTGDAAAIAGINMGEMGSIINKTTTANKAYNGDLQQLSDRGLPVYQWLAEEAGVTADAIFDMASKGEISSEMLMNAIENNIGGAAQIMGEKSFTAALANVWAAVGRIGAAFLDGGEEGKGFFSQLKPLMAEFIEILDGAGDVASEWGAKFGEAFANMIQKLRDLKEWYDGLAPSVQNIINKVLLFGTIGAAALGPVLTVFGVFGGVISKVSIGLGMFLKFISPLTKGLKLFGGITATAGGKVSLLGRAIGLLSGPVGWIVTGVLALGTAFVTAYKKSETFRNFIDGLVDKFKKAWDAVKKFSDGITKMFQGEWGEGKSILSSLGLSDEQVQKVENAVLKVRRIIHDAKEKINEIWSEVSGFFIGEFEKIKSWWDKDGELITSAIATSFEWAMNAVKEAVDFGIRFVTELFRTFAPIVKGLWSVLWPTIVYVAKNAWESIKLVVGIGMDLIKGIISAVSAIIEGDWSRFGEILKETALSIWDRVTEFFGNMKDNALELFNKLTNGGGDKFIELRDNAIEKVKELVTSALEWLGDLPGRGVDKFVELKDDAIGKLSEMYHGVTGWLSDLVPGGIEKAVEIKDGIVGKIVELKDSVVGFFSDIYYSVTDWISQTRDEAGNKAGELRDRVMEPVNNLLERIIPPFQRIYEGIKLRMEQLSGILSYIWNLIRGTLIGFALMIYEGVRDKFNQLYNRTVEIYQNIRNYVVEKFTEMKDRVVSVALNLYESLKTRFLSIYNYLRDRAIAIKDTVIDHFTKLRDRVVSVALNLYERLRDRFLSIYNNLRDRALAIKDNVVSRFTQLRDSVVNRVTNLYERVKSWFLNIYNNLRDRALQIKDKVVQRFTELKNSVVRRITDLYNGVKTWFYNIYTYIHDKMRDAKNKAVDFAWELYDGAKGYFTDLVDAAKTMMHDIGNWIDKLKTGVVTKAKNLGISIANAAISGFNSLIGGINKVAKALGYPGPLIKTIDPLQKVGGSGGGARGGAIAAYSTGTDNHQGGAALVGDKGPGNKGHRTREIVQEPGKDPYMVEKPTLIGNLKKGATVLNNKMTEKLVSNQKKTKKLKSPNGGMNMLSPDTKVPKGVGAGLGNFSGILSTPGLTGQNKMGEVGGKVGKLSRDVWDYRDDPAGLARELISKYANFNLPKAPLEIAARGVKKLTNPLKNRLAKLFEEFGGDGGDGSSFTKYPKSTPYSPNRAVPGYPGFNGGRHYGIDYKTPIGTTITAPTSGKVSRLSDKGGGNVAKLFNGKFTQLFMHLLSVFKTGQVSQGEPFAKTGNSGLWTTGPHLHYQVEKGNSPYVTNRNTVDPEKFLAGTSEGGGGKSTGSRAASRWRPEVIQALKKNGLPTTKAYQDAWIRQIQTESGGNSGITQSMAVNDINARTGNLARGLVQVIPTTFSAYKKPGHGNIMNGLDNLIAGMNYAKSRYGPSGMLNRIGKGIGYFKGGITDGMPELAWLNEEGFRESIISHNPAHRERSENIWNTTGQMLGFGNDETTEVLKGIQKASLQTNRLLQRVESAIENKESYVKVDDIFEGYNRKDARENSKRNVYSGRVRPT